jgi:glycosyltransferase involved in cell wall biosynthesis
MKYSVVIATYNRADDLRETLASLAELSPDGPWEVIVVDNNSPDATRQIVETAARGFPVELRYLFEREQGRSPALNVGIRAARGGIIATTDDDVRVPAGWLNAAAAALARHQCEYVGGRVLPIWGAPPPPWIPDHASQQWGVIALLDYGPQPIEFGARVPLGVNMAFSRAAFDRAGLFDPGTGRRAGTLLGQEVREWCIRARKAGVRGFYAPEMTVRHIIPAERLTRRYFRRWFYWRGISRAMLYARTGLDMEKPEQGAAGARSLPHVAGVPRYLYRKAFRHVRHWAREIVRRRQVETFEHELWLWFFAGIVRQRLSDTVRSRGGRHPSPDIQPPAPKAQLPQPSDVQSPTLPGHGGGAQRIATSSETAVDATVLICTYNRGTFLADTLDSLARLRAPGSFTWDVLVVDNNSTDGTRAVVESRAASFPVPLRYLFEGRQGKSNALNAGMSSTPARVIVFTDDDVRVPPVWLEAGVLPLLERSDIEYTGGPVRPVWGGPRPPWLDEKGNLGGTIAVKDHGAEPFIFEERKKTPLGVNMAVRRTLVERIGGFRPDLGRRGQSLLGQEQAEFFYRSREAGARGLYVPEMILDHLVPASRLTRSYFRRWWYWKGVSHARLHRIHNQTELGLDLARVPRIAGIPRFIFGTVLGSLRGWMGAWVSGSAPQRAERALMLAYAAGYMRESRRAYGPETSEDGLPLEAAGPSSNVRTT